MEKVKNKDLLHFTALAVPLLHSQGIYPLDWKLANLCLHDEKLRLIDQDMLVTANQVRLSVSKDDRRFVPLGAVATYPYKYMCDASPYNGVFNPLTIRVIEAAGSLDTELYMSVTWSAVVTLLIHCAVHVAAPQLANDPAGQNVFRQQMQVRIFENLSCDRIGKQSFWQLLLDRFSQIPTGIDPHFDAVLNASKLMPAAETSSHDRQARVENFWDILLTGV